MTTPCIVCVAITRSLQHKSDNQAVPISVAEQVESTQEAFEIGASIVHCHVRDDEGQPSSDPARFGHLQEGIQKHCDGMTIRFSTGGRPVRGGMLPLQPDMASLAVGSNNFASRVYEYPPELVDWLTGQMMVHDVKPEIEVFDLSHLFKAAEMVRDGKIKDAPYVQFVMGVKNAMPADREFFDFYMRTTRRLLPCALWCGAGKGRHQVEFNEWCTAAGGHVRTGLEDNVRLDRNTLAPSNAALVRRATELCERHASPVATWEEAPMMLGLRRAGARTA